jgi:tape measure domain-containing protein
MAMTLDTAIKFTAKLEGTGLDQLKRNLQGLSQQSNVSKRSLDQLYTATKALGSASNNTVAGLQRTVGALKALRDNAEFGSRKFKLLTNDIEAAERRLQRFQSTASSSGGLSRGGALLAGAAGGVAGAVAVQAADLARRGVQGIGQVGLDAESSRVRLRALTNEFGEYNAALAATDRIAKTLRLSNTEAEQSFASLYASLRPTGITLAELEKAFVGFSAAARNSGATAQETSNALIQLKQGLASGVLQGEELRSIREQAPLAAQAIAKELGVTIGELKDLASEGKVTTDVVLRALGKLGDTQLGKLNEQFQTGQQAIKDFQVATQELGIELARIFGPTAISLLRNFTGALKEASDVLGGITGNGEAGRRAQLRVQANQQAARETTDKFGVFSFFQQGSKNQFLLKREQEIFQELLQQQTRPADQVTASQREAQERAAKERASAAERTAMEKAKKNLADQLKLREEMEKRLADFREQSIQRAADLERDLGDQRMELERSTAEARRRVQEQQQDFALEAERQRLRGAGLSTDALDTQARLNEATRRFAEQKIQIEQNATDRKVQLERTLEDYKLNVARGIRDILVDGAEKMAAKMREGARGAAGAMGAPMASGGIIARTGSTGQSTGPHLDARWADGRPISAADADRYLSVNGRSPSSYGVTSGYGPRSLFGRSFHRGIDFGTPSGSGVSLKGGASLLRDLGFTGAGGYAVEIDTPEGRMRLLHLQGGSAARPVGSARQLIGRPGAAAAAASGVDLSGIDAAGKRLDAASGANRSASLAAAAGELVNSRQAELGTITSQLDQQRKSVREQREDFDRMLVLQREGLSPELARQQAERERMARTEDASLQTLRDQLTLDLQGNDLTQQDRIAVEKILADTILRQDALKGVVEGLNAEEQALDRLNQAYERQKELARGIAGIVGNGIGSAIDLLIDGTENWGDSLRNIAATVLKDIARQIAQTMVIAPIVDGITKGLSPGGGIAKFFGFANGGIMTGDGPMPLRKYAAGGIANSPQLAMFGEGSMPEAYVPLPDGRRIPVAMKGGGGGTNVTVNVDATGSQVQGNSGQGEQLGRAISQAVQNELVRQKRPGGLLAA